MLKLSIARATNVGVTISDALLGLEAGRGTGTCIVSAIIVNVFNVTLLQFVSECERYEEARFSDVI